MRIVRSTSAMVRRVTCRRIGTAALLTTTSSPPKWSQIWRARSAAASGSDRSAAQTRRGGGGGEAVGEHRIEAVGPAGHQRHGVAPAGEGPGEGGTDARGRAGDEDRPASLRSTHPGPPQPCRLRSAASPPLEGTSASSG